MKRHLKRFKQLLAFTMMVIGISQSIVTEAYSQTLNGPPGVSCDCQTGLPTGWKVMDISFSGTPDANFVIINSSDLFNADETPLTEPFAFTEGSSGRYEAQVLADVSGAPVVGIGFLDGAGQTQIQNILSFPASCTISAVELVASPDTDAVCISSMAVNYTAIIPSDPMGASYDYEFTYTVSTDNGASTFPISGSGSPDYTFPAGIPLPSAGDYVIGVVAEQFNLDGTTTGCTYEDTAPLTVYDLSNMISVMGSDEICNTSMPSNYFVGDLPGDFTNNQDLEWTLTGPGGVVNNFTATGSGTSIDFVGQPVGDYVISVSGMTDDGCLFDLDYDVSLVNPEGVLLGPSEVTCGSTQTYTAMPEGGTSAGTAWSVVGGIITSSDDDTATVAWDTDGSITASGVTGDGCMYTITTATTIVSGVEAYSIEGDTHVCGDETIGVYNLTSTAVASSGYTYTWTLLDDSGAAVACAISPTVGDGTSQLIDYSCLDIGDYTLSVAAASTTCPDFTVESPLTIADPSIINSIACVSGGLNVTIGNSCTLEVTADLLLQGAGTVNNDAYDIELTNATTGEAIVGTVLDHSYINQEIEVKVIDQCSGNSCWGFITVEDKSIPALECPSVVPDVDCLEAADKTNEDFMPIFDPTVVITYNGDETWTLEGYDNCGDATLTCEDINQSMGECDNPRFLSRIWTVTDEYGATSTCRVDITVTVDDNNLVTFPPNFDDVLPGAEPSIDVCSVYPTDADGNPDPSFTGMPEAASCVDVVVLGYTDTNLELCGDDSPSRKVIREWAIWNPCGNDGLGEDFTYTQYITLTDTTPPICAAFNEFSVTTDGHDCGATIFVPQPQVTNECGRVYIDMTYKLRDDNGIIPALFSDEGVTYDPMAQGFTIDNVSFESDSLWILFEVRDGCGNSTTDCLTEVALIDNTPPTPVCDLFNNISLNADGRAYAGPGTFDDSSNDNCGVYQTVIQRMDEGAPCGDCATPRYDFLSHLGDFNGSSYFISKSPTTGPKSLAYANALDAHVATIETEGENTWLYNQVSALNIDSYFIGYVGEGITNADSPENSDFAAQSGGVMNYDNWDSGEPTWTLTGTGELYVNVQAGGTWAAERESVANHYYIVEVENPCSTFSQQVEFCCADIGTDVQVRMRVFDTHGNFAECMVMVTVQDFKDPTVSNVPGDLEFDCEDLEGTDYLLGEDSEDLLLFGTPTFNDNCDFVVDYQVNISNETDCGSFNIVRSWTATDSFGNSVSASQTITVGELTPFSFGNIDFPDDYDAMDCSAGVSPDDLPFENAYPVLIGQNACSNVTFAYDDQVFNYTEIACAKILRTWTVIDWCQPGVEWTHVQVIKIFDSEAPVVVSGCQDLTEVAGEEVGNCMIETYESGLGLSVADNCSTFNQIQVWYDLDLNNDGSYEMTGVQSDNANGIYPYGTHKITWYALDNCGNEMAPCSMTFIIEGETDGPTAYCLTEVVTTIPVAGTAEIWAADFDQGSFAGNCNENDDLSFSFSADITDTFREFDCSDLAQGVTDTIQLEMWVTDSNGDQSYCTTFLILQDNHDVCPNGGASRAMIAGKVYTETGEMVDQVEMSLMAGEVAPMMTYMTEDGEYGFADVPMYNDYQVNAYSNDNPLNGVSTLDIVLIQRHILGLQDLNSPYKLIAADANNSSSVSAIDLIVIRKLILGLTSEFPNNDSWRFVDQEYAFVDETSPWPFSEALYINDLDHNLNDEDFIAVKIGDVNNTVVANYTSNPVELRSNEKFEIGLNSAELDNGNSKLELTAANDGSFVGAQFSISLEGGELMNVIPGALTLTEKNFTIANGELLVSFDQVDGVNVSEDDVLFAVELSNAKTVNLTETLRSEVYVEGNGGVEVMEIELDSAVDADAIGFSVYQNTPNPFSEETTIAFELPSSSVVNLQVFDNSGKVLFADSGNFNRGYNEFSIKQSELETTGILYYQISTDTHIATRKMIVLK